MSKNAEHPRIQLIRRDARKIHTGAKSIHATAEEATFLKSVMKRISCLLYGFAYFYDNTTFS